MRDEFDKWVEQTLPNLIITRLALDRRYHDTPPGYEGVRAQILLQAPFQGRPMVWFFNYECPEAAAVQNPAWGNNAVLGVDATEFGSSGSTMNMRVRHWTQIWDGDWRDKHHNVWTVSTPVTPPTRVITNPLVLQVLARIQGAVTERFQNGSEMQRSMLWTFNRRLGTAITAANTGLMESSMIR